MTNSKDESMIAPANAPDAAVPHLSHDPYRIRENDDKVLKVSIGLEVRSFRRQQGITVADLASMTGLSIGMLSKIENGNTSPSLTTLQLLANALSVPIAAFFRRSEEARHAVHTRAGEWVESERAGDGSGLETKLLGHIGANSSGVVVEPYMVTIGEDTDGFVTSQNDGIAVLYMLEGELDYRHGDNIYPLKPGDTLFFDADAPHGPERLVKAPARYLSITSYPQSK